MVNLIWLELLKASREALNELQPSVSDSPGYYADPEQVARLEKAVTDAELFLQQYPNG